MFLNLGVGTLNGVTSGRTLKPGLDRRSNINMNDKMCRDGEHKWTNNNNNIDDDDDDD